MAELLSVPDWYRVRELGDGLTLVQEPSVDPLLSANTWHLRGRARDVLVDCGLGVVSLPASLPDLFGDREPVVVLTHAHLDHMGSAHEFRDCWAHPEEPVDVPGRGSLHARTLARILGLGEDEGGAAGPAWLLGELPSPTYDPAAYVLRPVRPSRVLLDGDVVDLGDRQLQVLHLPGHTPGSIALYEPDTRTLFSGDVVYDDELLDSLHESDKGHYAASMRRLLALDVETVHAGHDESFGADRLTEIAESYLASATATPTRKRA